MGWAPLTPDTILSPDTILGPLGWWSADTEDGDDSPPLDTDGATRPLDLEPLGALDLAL